MKRTISITKDEKIAAKDMDAFLIEILFRLTRTANEEGFMNNRLTKIEHSPNSGLMGEEERFTMFFKQEKR